ncbi:MAG: hypothetical protein DMG05_15965 [Acidobacteria bacterium]|nr:MAG: hypothetical protein DMG05_15965 [Acidobacteriota bacterium]
MYINISETGSRKKVLSVRRPLQSGKKYATLRGGHVSSQIRERSPQPPWQLELSRQKEEIEQFALSLPAPALYQDGLKIGLLEELNFTLGFLGHRLLLCFQLRSRQVKRKIVDVRRQGSECLEIQAGHLNLSELFEIRSVEGATPLNFFKESRKKFQKYVEQLILRNFPKAKIIKSVVHTDLEHSISGKYVRLLFISGRNRWAALAANPLEDQSTLDGILSNGLIWREHLKLQESRPVGKLLLVVPVERGHVLKSRLRWIRGAGKEIYLMEMDTEKDSLVHVDIKDSGNVDTLLTQVYSLGPRIDLAQTETFKRVMSLASQHINPVLRTGSNCVSFRIRGLEFASLHVGSAGKLTFGVGKQEPVDTASDWNELKRLVDRIIGERQATPKSRRNLFYRLQAERWLESLIVPAIQIIDTELNPHHVYPQVPAFWGADRGMIDILGVTKPGRLAVLELKVNADIELPMQGLDYWLRVRWHQLRDEFSRKGYFHDVELSTDPPLLYFVSPQFCYHNTFPKIVKYIDPSIPMIEVGINENWRAGIQVVM